MVSPDTSLQQSSEADDDSSLSHPALMTCWRSHLLPFIVLFLALAGAYANVFDNPFVIDDSVLIVDPIREFREGIQANGPGWGMQKILRLPLDQPYRWFRLLSYYLDYLIWGGSFFGLHATNLLCHLIASYFVYLSASALTSRRVFALLCALAFALHPIQTDSVTYLSGRRDVLMGCFFFAGFYAALRYEKNNRRWLLIGACLAYSLAVFSKEMAITLPLVVFLALFSRRFENSHLPPGERLSATFRTTLRERADILLPLFALSVFFFFYFTLFLNVTLRESYYGGTFVLNVLTEAKVWIYYLYLLLFPFQLIADYTGFMAVVSSVGDPHALLAIAVLVLLAGVMIWLFLKLHIWPAFGLAWFGTTLLPVSHIIPHHELMAEHYLYLPTFGFLFFILHLLDKAVGREMKRLVLLLVPLLLLAGVRTFVRNHDWGSEYRLYEKTVAQVPENPRAHMNFGVVLLERGEINKALHHLSRATALQPSLAKPHFNLGRAYFIQGEIEQAINQFDRIQEATTRVIFSTRITS